MATWLFLAAFDSRLAWALLTFLLLAGVALPLAVGWLSRGPGRQSTTLRAELGVEIVDGLQGMADLVAFGREGDQLDRVRSLNRRWAQIQERMGRLTALHSAVGTLLANLGMAAVLLAAIPLVTGGEVEGVYLPVLVLVALASFEAVSPLPLAFQHLSGCIEAARRLFEIAGAEGETGRRSGSGGLDGRGETAAHHPSFGTQRSAPLVSIRNLRFRYGPDQPWVLDGVSFDVKARERIALVGPSGAGKSTLLYLLLRFWDYQEGQILLAGKELAGCPAEAVRRHMATVSQRTHLFGGTLRQNLLLACPEATDGRLSWALQQARLHPLVQSLPDGLDTWIGEQGLLLSGGERQRVAIARALLKDTPILLLDEPTANLDSITERDVMRSLHSLMEDRATILVTHRLAGLDSMDQILVLRAGRLVEQGTHGELLDKAGLYRRMWESEREVLSS